MKYAPIALFTYNRIDKTKKVIKSLQKNKEAKNSDLIIYSDGPKETSLDHENVLNIRHYLETITGFKSVSIIKSKVNKGLAASIIYGVTNTINTFETIIVLEDDCVVSEFFLDFMNKGLIKYKHNQNIMHINGFLPPLNINPQCSFFSPLMGCWGWATWKESWQYFNNSPDYFITTFSKKDKLKFNLNNTYNFFGDILRNKSKKINTWAIFWYASIFLKQGLCLTPNKSLVQNIGTDDSGQNFHFSTTKYLTILSTEPIRYFPTKINYSEPLFLAYCDFYKSHKLTFWQHLKLKSKKIIRLLFTFK